MMTKVLRPISGIDAPRGAIVDSTEWRNEGSLISAKYLLPVPEGTEATFEVDVEPDEG